MATVEIEVVGKDSFSGTLGNFGNIITGIKSAIDLVSGGFRTFADVAMDGLDAIASYERLSATFETLIAKELLMTGAAGSMSEALALSGTKAEELIRWNEELAIKSPFTSEGVAQAFRMAMAYGFTVEESQRLTQAMIDFAAGSGASEYAMQQIARALGQISATGKLTGGDMLQLVNAGLPVAQILADAFGVTTSEVMAMREKGLIPAKDAIEAITVYLETNFAGAAERQANTWAGLQGTFADLKAMGLREFFGGLFDAVQPLVVAFAEWAQGPGLLILGTLGDMLGSLATSGVDKLKELAPIFNTLNLAFLEFRNLIQNDWSPLDALHKVLGDLAIVWEGTPLEGIIQSIQNFITTGETEGWGEAIRGLFTGLLDNLWNDFGWRDKLQELLDNLVIAIGGTDWTTVGTTLGNLLGNAISIALSGLHTVVNEINWQPLGDALWEAFKGILSGFFTSENLSDALEPFKENIKDNWISMLFPFIPNDEARPIIFANMRTLAASVVEGFTNGINSIELNITDWVREKIIDPVKRFLGISSPSTVFKGIGGDIIAGLLAGLGAAWNSVTTWFETKFTTLLENLTWENIMKIVSGDMELSDLFVSATTGSVGGRSGGGTIPGGDTTGSTLTGTTTNTFNFYGTVYMSGVGPEGTFDCPSPHPIMIASSQSLLTSGVA